MDRILTRGDLLRAGLSVRQIARAVHVGDLVRVRRGRYVRRGCDPGVEAAARIGGRLACVSELRRRGVWVLDDGRLHVEVARNAARLRRPDARERPLGADREHVRIHWVSGGDDRQSAIEAIIQSSQCVGPRAFGAIVDSALRSGQVSIRDLVRARPRLAVAMRNVEPDASAESGLESIVRTLLRDVGLRVEPQVVFAGIGRVDLLVEGRVVVELDGDEYHDVKIGTRDRARDARLVTAGNTVVRFRYAQVVFEPESVVAAVISAVQQHRRVRNSGAIAVRARRRLRRLEFS
jgi:very-short-patch-repair endonuclease